MWPPDVFCLAAAVLQASGAYSRVVDDSPPHGTGKKRATRTREVKRVGSSWRKSAVSARKTPARLQAWWQCVRDNQEVALTRLGDFVEPTLCLLNLLAAADEASAGLGLFFNATRKADAFERQGERRLFQTAMSETGATLCQQIPPTKGRVLPKRHTPQNGLTIRSLSHNLAYSYTPDVKPEWISAAQDTKHHCFNLLVVPWPFNVEPNQFTATRSKGVADVVQTDSYGLFTYAPSPGPSLEFVRKLLAFAQAKLGQVDGIVFPELAMSRKEFEHLATDFVTPDCFLVSGVGRPSRREGDPGLNQALLQIGLRLAEGVQMGTLFEQRKHHRWKLTKSQILQYGLAGSLHPETDWWEHISVGERTLSFVTFRPWLTMSVLICEDLARPDPVGDVLRAVGPNLIIALLTDGPQVMGRWPGRYAGALADDPGSSVLTVTSLGASTLSKPSSGNPNRSRSIALWRDAKNGARELELPQGASALLLNMTVEYHEEWTADGRSDGKDRGTQCYRECTLSM